MKFPQGNPQIFSLWVIDFVNKSDVVLSFRNLKIADYDFKIEKINGIYIDTLIKTITNRIDGDERFINLLVRWREQYGLWENGFVEYLQTRYNSQLTKIGWGKEEELNENKKYKKGKAMTAKSKAQQRFFGMVDAYKKGEMPKANKAIRDAADSMTKKEVKKFAETKHKGLPEHTKKKVNESQLRNIVKNVIKEAINDQDVYVAEQILMIVVNERDLSERMSNIAMNLVKKIKRGVKIDREQLTSSKVVDDLVKIGYKMFAESQAEYEEVELSDIINSPSMRLTTERRRLAALRIAEYILNQFNYNMKSQVNESLTEFKGHINNFKKLGLSKKDWFEIISQYYTECLAFWNEELKRKGMDNRYIKYKARQNAWNETVNLNHNPYKPQGEDIPCDIKQEWLADNYERLA